VVKAGEAASTETREGSQWPTEKGRGLEGNLSMGMASGQTGARQRMEWSREEGGMARRVAREAGGSDGEERGRKSLMRR
jgi:hypothetical protein